MNPRNYIDKKRLFNDSEQLKRIAKENRQLLIKINSINRTKGWLDCYNPNAYADKSRWRKHELEMLDIERQNKKLYKRLVTAVSKFLAGKILRFLICHYCSHRLTANKKWKNSGEVF